MPSFGGTVRPSTSPARPSLIFGVNLVGVVPGTLHPERYIVVSAHFDHLGTRNGLIWHGADDNASGTAAILAIAEWTVTHPPLNSIIFVWFDAEEEGLLGSQTFVDRPPVPLDKIIADENLDMISRSKTNELNVVGAYAFPVMQPLIDSIATLGLVRFTQRREGRPGDKFGDDVTDRSDQAPFFHKKIPFVFFNNEEHADYHQPTDVATSINPEFYYNSARTAAAFLRLLDSSLDQVAAVRQARK